MNNLLTVPDHLKNSEARNMTSAMSEGVGGQPFHRISRNSNKFTFKTTDGKEIPHDKFYLDVVIVDVNPVISKIYYEGGYNSGGNNNPPTCFSDNGLNPSERSPKPQCGTCAQCPKAQWLPAISAATGKATRRSECRNQRKLAVIVPELIGDMLFEFIVPAGSLKNSAEYARTIQSTSLGHRNADLSDVITRISFSDKGMGVLEFKPVGFVDAETLKRVEALAQSDEPAMIVGKKELSGQHQPRALPAPTNDIPGYGRMGHNNPPEPIDEIPDFSDKKPAVPNHGMVEGSPIPANLKANLQKSFGSSGLDAAMNLKTK